MGHSCIISTPKTGSFLALENKGQSYQLGIRNQILRRWWGVGQLRIQSSLERSFLIYFRQKTFYLQMEKKSFFIKNVSPCQNIRRQLSHPSPEALWLICKAHLLNLLSPPPWSWARPRFSVLPLC